MSVIDLQTIKDALRQTQSDDDNLLQRLTDSAESEAKRFLNRSELPTLPLEYPSSIGAEEVPSSEDPVAPDVVNAVILLVQADYDGDPLQRDALRRCAESLLMPYRNELGV